MADPVIESGYSGSSSRVLHLVPGRVRLHLPSWTERKPAELERALCATAGVLRASASPVTRNILIHYDPAVTNPAALQQALRAFASAPAQRAKKASDTAGLIQERIEGRRRRARIAVPDLDRDPQVAARVLRRLRRRPGVTASANPLTGRVLVEFDENAVSLEELLGDALGTGRAPESAPHPLDRAPLMQGSARLAGAALGLAVTVVGQLLQTQLRSRRAITIAAVLSAVQGSPALRHALRRRLGPTVADAVLALPSIAALTFAGNPLGLALAAWDALRLVGDLRATRGAWQRYEQRCQASPAPEPGAIVQLDTGQHAALPGVVRSGTGLAIAPDGLPFVVRPGESVAAGTRIHSGPVTVELQAGDAFDVGERPDPARPAPYDQYMQRVGPMALGLAALLALITRSLSRGAATLLLVNARPALVGIGAAETGARAQVARSRGVVVGTRPERRLRKPDVLLLSSPRLLTRGLELSEVIAVDPEMEERAVVELAGSLAQAADSPWSAFLRPGAAVEVEEAATDEHGSHGTVRGRHYRLRELRENDSIPAGLRRRRRHDAMLLLEEAGRPLAALVLRPRLSAEAERLRRACGRAGVRLQVLSRGNPVQARALAQRASIELVEGDVVTAIRTAQRDGDSVAFASDGLEAGPGFAAADLAIGVADDDTGFGARADLLAADVAVIADIIDACAHRDAAAQDAFVVSLLTDALGLVLSLRGTSSIELGSRPVELGSLVALALSRMQFRNGYGRPAPVPYSDPRPERWGRQPIESVLQLLHSSTDGLTSDEARRRRVAVLPRSSKNAFLQAVQTELRSPLIGLLAAGAVVSLAIGSAGDVVIIVVTLGVNVLLSAWQSYRAGSLAKEVESIGTPTARVLRDGSARMLPADQLVPGDVLILQSGVRIAADARLIEAEGIEVDEAALTGESLPVAKTAAQATNGASVVLAGTAVVMGSGLAVVVAVGEHTRMGAMAVALSHDEGGQSPLGVRLAQLVRTVVPLSLGGGLVVVLSGVLWGEPLVPRIALGLSIALAVFPEGLPLLAAVGQSAVASRLARRNALARRVAAIEALGRVDVACVDKTGTLTTGTLAVHVISDFQDSVSLPHELSDSHRRVLLAAALASPHPDAEDVAAHSTDLAIVRAAESAGLGEELDVDRMQEAKFNSVRAYHAVQAGDRVWVKGAPEVVASRCRELDSAALLEQAERLAAEGLRVLLVAEGPAGTSVDDPQQLTAIGFVGISDPLRESVPEALRRCREAGIKIMMLTGDHPVTARTIARAAGLDLSDNGVCTGAELGDLADDELDRKLERVSVIARATPFDKLRIVESLQRRGHTVAMTGDGINDAPALHLADVGVAMGGAGTEVARQSSDLILADDDFSTLVEALVEGRGFWHSIRRALGLLLGGNLGELALVVSAAALGRAVPLTVRQILATNLITDALPALAVATRPPEHRYLPQLAREGPASLDRPLRDDILRRSVATAAPSIGAYLLALGSGDLAQARSVAFSAIIVTQLSQTLALGQAEGTLTRPVAAAVVASGGAMGLLLGVSPLRRFFDLVLPSPYGWTLIVGSAVLAPALNRMLTLAQPPSPPELSQSPAG